MGSNTVYTKKGVARIGSHFFKIAFVLYTWYMHDKLTVQPGVPLHFVDRKNQNWWTSFLCKPMKCVLYNTSFSRALYIRANSQICKISAHEFSHFSLAFYRYLVCQNRTIIKEAMQGCRGQRYYFVFYWSDFDKQRLILKLRNFSNQNLQKLSVREFPSTVKL